MSFQVGDSVIHPVHGAGTIIQLAEEKQGDATRHYYVVAGRGRLTLWVPVDAPAGAGLRPVVSASRFTRLLDVLASPAEPLNDQALDRQHQIAARFSLATPEAICGIIRDLTARSLTKRLNENDNKMLRRAREALLDEWVLSMHVKYQDAQTQLVALLNKPAPVID